MYIKFVGKNKNNFFLKKKFFEIDVQIKLTFFTVINIFSFGLEV